MQIFNVGCYRIRVSIDSSITSMTLFAVVTFNDIMETVHIQKHQSHLR